jgi:hypothetical protein
MSKAVILYSFCKRINHILRQSTAILIVSTRNNYIKLNLIFQNEFLENVTEFMYR